MTTAFSGLGQTTGTAAERVALVSPQVGQLFFETDTTLFKVWTGSTWITTLIGLTAGGGLTGTYPNPTVASISGLTAGGGLTGTYPNPTVASISGLTAGGGLTGTYPNPTIRSQWAAKQGPLSLSSAYKNVWDKAVGAGTYLDWNASNSGITINVAGNYEVILNQRMNGGGDNYLGISLNGDRTTLENRATGIWSHDHEAYSNAWCSSYYLGALNATEIISGGGVSSTNFTYTSAGWAGFLSIKYVGQL